MNTIRIALICLGLLALSACKEKYNGTLNVYSPMAVNKSNMGAVTINKGSYPALLKVNSKKKVTLEVKYPSGTVKIPFAVNVDLNTLAPGQKVQLQPEVTGQPFTAVASYDREDTRSSDYDGVEDCTYETREYRCWIVREESDCRLIDGKKYCEYPREHQECGDISVTHRGRQNVRYHYEYTEQFMKYEIIKNGSLIATLAGSNQDSDKVYSYKDTCY